MMISEERLLTVLITPYITEKTSFIMEKGGVAVFRVDKRFNKLDIKHAVKKIFSVDVCSVRTVNIKKKVKKGVKNINKKKFWKKAYVTLGSGQKIDFFKINPK